ncbi:methionyl-tRNA formyltransferase [Rhodospirillum rubrum]|uniref:Methionyl-tRNA formyltransferase n=1 Tax=Rhodospirillum rubrum (strain ATCC 11170 / ATH 1.1.1 / DSM 467 / LMG 4362 / NCIMB 8255 / S1) TaxID=269796 RepID=Q2RP00_RHORT|nr:methionyl-tRNA formyltransferase [Rhodospirillum rubrum]ABC24145.1 methionyl-tRNA formyltransferase [Rhodospirillum rubrum ATCC 11170]AEO49896.1 methionyl-tRNA formyltransferase [Rhodospirillum rubrum F11]MBK5955859.1 methionyl-tRNA formyltransferase [Rhodospirillum rubrum]HAP98840.1 methionyl-tRNA formyltransferase [Rhodospirillum rubrum]
MTLSVVFMGTPAFSVPILHALHNNPDLTLRAVYCQPPRAAGRGKKPRPTPVHAAAEALGIPVFTPARLRDAADQQAFAELAADVAVVAAYGLILPKAVLDAPRLGCVNVHASLLPRWRGAAPIHRAIMAGDRETGVTLMQMDEGLDTGAMLRIGRVAITEQTTTASLHDTLSALGAEMIGPALRDLAAGTLSGQAQPTEGVTYAAKIDKAEARLEWRTSAAVLDRQIRALSPFPGAWFERDGERIKVLMSRVEEGVPAAPPGQLLDNQLTVACGEGAVRLLCLQRPGRGPLAADDFLRGYAFPAGLSLT